MVKQTKYVLLSVALVGVLISCVFMQAAEMSGTDKNSVVDVKKCKGCNKHDVIPGYIFCSIECSDGQHKKSKKSNVCAGLPDSPPPLASGTAEVMYSDDVEKPLIPQRRLLMVGGVGVGAILVGLFVVALKKKKAIRGCLKKLVKRSLQTSEKGPNPLTS